MMYTNHVINDSTQSVISIWFGKYIINDNINLITALKDMNVSFKLSMMKLLSDKSCFKSKAVVFMQTMDVILTFCVWFSSVVVFVLSLLFNDFLGSFCICFL